MLMGSEWEGLGREGEFFGVVEAEEGVRNRGSSVVDNFDGLLSLPSELHHLGLDADQVRTHASVKLTNDYYPL